MARVKKDDKVILLSGKDKSKQGTVLQVLNNQRVLVEGLNLVKKHQKPNPQKGEPGGVVEIESSVHISNVAIFNPVTEKADRVRYLINDNGKKVRVFASNNEVIDL